MTSGRAFGLWLKLWIFRRFRNQGVMTMAMSKRIMGVSGWLGRRNLELFLLQALIDGALEEMCAIYCAGEPGSAQRRFNAQEFLNSAGFGAGALSEPPATPQPDDRPFWLSLLENPNIAAD